MPVASYMDTEILCLMRLIGMCMPDKHIRRSSDDPLARPPLGYRSFSDLCVPVLMWHLDSSKSIYLLEKINNLTYNFQLSRT